MSAYGGWVQIRSILSSFINDKLFAFPCLVNIFEFSWQIKFRFVLDNLTASEFISTPIAFRPNNFASINVVPLPKNWSSIQSFFFEYLKIIFLGIYGDQFPLYFLECVAQFPLSGKDHIVVSSNLNLSGVSLIRNSPFFFCSLYFCSTYLSIKILKINIKSSNIKFILCYYKCLSKHSSINFYSVHHFFHSFLHFHISKTRRT